MSDVNEDNLMKTIIKCVNFAAVKHRNQRRLDLQRTPFINHPIGVAYILTEAGVTDPIVIQSAILHDTVEDTDTTIEEIEKEFGTAVSKVVSEVTDDKSLPKEERKRLQIVHSYDCSREAKLVKLADKLYNLRDLNTAIPSGWSKKRVDEYFEWSFKVVEGLRDTNQSIEDKLDTLFVQRDLL